MANPGAQNQKLSLNVAVDSYRDHKRANKLLSLFASLLDLQCILAVYTSGVR